MLMHVYINYPYRAAGLQAWVGAVLGICQY